MKIKKPKVTKAPQRKQAKKRKSQFRTVDEVCKPDMIAFHFWREWHQAKDRNDYEFLFEMTREGSAFREALGDQEAFPEACRRREDHIPGMKEGELLKISLEGPDVAHMFEVIRPSRQTGRKPVRVRRWYMLRSENGWRLDAIHELETPEADLDAALQTKAFPDVSPPEGFVTFSEAAEAKSSEAIAAAKPAGTTEPPAVDASASAASATETKS